jgi:hypothetical protein
MLSHSGRIALAAFAVCVMDVNKLPYYCRHAALLCES